MSNAHQEETLVQPEHTNAVGIQPITSHASATKSSPLKRKHGPNQAFTVEPYDYQEVRNELDIEMHSHWWGPMPVKLFFEKFVPCAAAPLPDLPEDPFKSVPSNRAESVQYRHFITAVQEWMPHLCGVNTSSKVDMMNSVKLKTDITIYDRMDGVVDPVRTDFSHMELWIEFKAETRGPAFEDPADSSEETRLLAIENGSFVPDTVEGSDTRGQMAHYAGAQHSMQFRNLSFSILVEDNHARLLQWDRAGTIVTASFNYREEPKFMAELLWWFDHMSAEQRGRDETVQPADLGSEDAMRVRKILGIKGNVPLHRYTIPGQEGNGYAYGPRPLTINRSLASRFTRTTPVVWIPTASRDERVGSCTEPEASSKQDAHLKAKEGLWYEEENLMFMKDAWRYVSDLSESKIMPEHKIYEILHRNNTPNIPDLVAGGDVEGRKTRTQESAGEKWLCVKPGVCPFQHYQLIQGVIGRALVTFDYTKQLVTAVLDALKAHSHAYKVSQLLHWDITMGNIILTDEGRGLLIDWEMAKDVNEIRRTRPDRTGTWQFMSAKLLEDPCKRHTLTDDLESFLHVLGWMTLRYIPADKFFLPTDRTQALRKFDEYILVEGYDEQGGHGKSEVLRGGSYPWPNFKPRDTTPLSDLIVDLSIPFMSHYAVWPPMAEDRNKIDVSQSRYNERLEELAQDIRRYDRNMEKLKSSSFFINGIQEALDTQPWPMDDKADLNLPIPPLKRKTERQKLLHTSQLLDTQKTVGDSKGLSRSSKPQAQHQSFGVQNVITAAP